MQNLKTKRYKSTLTAQDAINFKPVDQRKPSIAETFEHPNDVEADQKCCCCKIWYKFFRKVREDKN